MTHGRSTLVFAPAEVSCLEEAFFAGAFRAREPISIRSELSPSANVREISEQNHWLIGSKWQTDSGERSYVNRDSNRGASLAFKGYVFGAETLHSASPPERLFRYWQGSETPDPSPNGVYSAAYASDRGSELFLLADCLGMSPLYFRCIDETVYFATNPRFLTTPADQPDLLAWKSLLAGSNLFGDQTLTAGVSRLPAGHSLIADATGVTVKPWYSFDQFADGDRPVDDAALREVEDSLAQAVDRCVSIPGYSVELPLSSGHDSRRILANLLASKTEFRASTVRVTQKNHRDLDAPFARQMSEQFEFPHRIIELGDNQEYASLDLERQLLVDNETPNHAWALRLMQNLPSTPSVVVDGVLGDILGNPGFRMPGMYDSTRQDLEIIFDELFDEDVDRHLPGSHWPPARNLRDYVGDYLEPFMHRRNMPEFAFILTRQRRSTALWSHQQIPAGHLVVCPYLDLDYLTLLFSFLPQSKHDTVIQRACLERFWPELASVPGNRDIPDSVRPGDPGEMISRDLVAYRALEAKYPEIRQKLSGLLGGKSRLLYRVSRYSQRVAARMLWMLQPLSELIARNDLRPPAFRFADAATGSAGNSNS